MLTVSRSAVDFSGLEGIWDGPSHSGNVCTVVRWISISGIFWEEWTQCAPDQRRKGSSSLLPATSPKPGSVMVWGCVSALGKGNLHFCDGTINAEKYIEILEHNMLPSRRHLFQGRPCIFQQDNAKPHSAHITKSWLRRKRVQVLDRPACSPDLSPIENVWRILKRKMRQRRPRTVAHLKTCLQEGRMGQNYTWNTSSLVSSVPKRLLSVVKRNGNITNW